MSTRDHTSWIILSLLADGPDYDHLDKLICHPWLLLCNNGRPDLMTVLCCTTRGRPCYSPVTYEEKFGVHLVGRNCESVHEGSQDSMVVRAPDSWSKGCEFEPWQELREEFSSPELTSCADSHSVSVPPPFWHKKDLGHTAKSAGGRLHLNTHTPLTQRSRSELTMPTSRHSVWTYSETRSHATCRGNNRPQSSQLHEPLWTDPDIMSGINVRELISC